MLRFSLLVLALALAPACKRSSPSAPDASAPAPVAAPRQHMRLLNAPASAFDGAAAVIVEAQKKSVAEKRRLLVYVSAPWCEPCQHFHEAVEKGELDVEFGDVDLLAFNSDVDAERLAYAGYFADLIPMLAVPGPDGRSTGKQMEGSVKGPAAVADMTPRLKALLALR